MAKKTGKTKDLAALVHAVMDESAENEHDPEVGEYIELEELNLPPRSEVHQHSPFRLTWNIQHPIFRFLVIMLVLASFIGGILYYVGDQLLAIFHL